MFNCTRRASKKVKEKVDFSIHFHATQIHTAWDKLAVSLVSLDSGKVTGKTRKASVRNGQCHWPDAVLETAKLILDMKTHMYDEKLYKFVVAKGFSRSCVLGEVIINITEYVTAASPTSVTLPLRFCYAGTLLHIKIQCLTPKSINKPLSWIHSGHVSDTETEMYSACGTSLPCTNSPAHYLCRTFSVGTQSPVASSATGECSRVLPSSPTQNAEKKSGMIAISYISLSSPARAVTPPPRDRDHPTRKDSGRELENWKNIAEALKKDLAAQKQELANLKMDADIDRSSYLAERNVLHSELEDLKNRSAELTKRSDCKEHIYIIDELKEELGLERDKNTSLNIQLQNLRKSNMELLLVVRDLEDSLEEHTRDTERLLKCKVYNNPCAEGDATLEGEERYSEYSYAAETKNIDKILDLSRNNDQHMDDETPRLKMFISAVSEDLSNMKVVLDELNRHTQVGDCYASVKEQLLFDLKALVQGSEDLIAELQKDSTTGASEITNRGKSTTDGESEEVKTLNAKIMELENLSKMHREQEVSRQLKIDQLESQLLEFVQELEHVQKSNEQLESLLGAAKTEKEHLEQMVEDAESTESLSQRVAELEDQVQRLEMEREDYLLERCVGENLARDLCKRVKSIVSGSQSDSDEKEKLDFMCHMKELRRSFSLLMINRRNSEDELEARQHDDNGSSLEEDEMPLTNNVELVDPGEVLRLQEELEKKAVELEVLDSKVVELTVEKGKVDGMLRSYMDQVEAREIRMDQLEAKLVNFSQELNSMQESNEQLESVLEATKAEKQRLEVLVQDAHEESRRELQDSEALLQRVTELEAHLKRLEGEKEAYALERSVAENLVRDLCEKLQAVTCNVGRAEYQEEGDCKFISHVKELRISFSSLAQMARHSEGRLQELQFTCGSLEDRLVKEYEKTLGSIAFLDEQFGQLSKESDQRIETCNRELEVLLSKLQQEQEEKRSQGFLRVALEENSCEIAYLRDELRRLKEQNAAMIREREAFKAEIQSLEAESVQWQSTLEELQEQFEHLQGVGRTKSQLATTEEALKALVSENRSLEEVLERKTTQHCKDKEEWQRKLAEMQEKVGRLEASTRTEEQEILLELEVLKADLESTTKTLIGLRTEKTSLDGQVNKLQMEVAGLTGQNVSTELTLTNLEAELEQYKTLIISLKEEVASAEKKLRAERDHREDTANKCMRLTGEIEDLKCKLLECSNLDCKLLSLQEMIESKTSCLELHWKSAHQGFQAKESVISETLGHLEEAYKQTTISFDAVVSELAKCKCLNSELEESLKTQTEAKKRTEEESWHLRREYKAMESRLSTLSEEKEEEVRIQLVEVRNLQRTIAQLEDDITRKLCEQRENSVSISTQTDCSQGQETAERSTENSNEVQDMKHGRRKWKQQHDDQDIELRSKIASLEAELHSKAVCLSSTLEKSQEREATLCEKIVHLEAAKRTLEDEVGNRRDESGLMKALAEVEECKLARASLEKTISHLQSQVESDKHLLAEKELECALLKEEYGKLKLAIAELQEKHATLVKMVASQEVEASSNSPGLELLRFEFQEKEALLWKKIEYLELANEQLAGQQVDSGLEQLKRELTRLQNHNSELIRREHELTSKLSAYELLQLELQRLQEDNEQLEQKFLKLKDASLWGDTLERLVYLETELAEALEANTMYKLQLQSVFAKSVSGAAAQGTSEVEGIIANLVSFKKQTLFLEAELKEMQERYLSMSMRYAEIQSEREELVMTVKALRSSKQ
ncbi:plectin [Selaginella moellendorffii]|uniref:plectin n=1 Tax=Selaginella moellendorffii TaxID=88036 RepID=UPI000D1CEC41|nr:plectin [Selaginella moellendorffii]XP_024514751.1 plectin [Selaginella moellendorffii]|eukprot:XP_024514750.1 plectin [Selaginella moellendorffii]